MKNEGMKNDAVTDRYMFIFHSFIPSFLTFSKK